MCAYCSEVPFFQFCLVFPLASWWIDLWSHQEIDGPVLTALAPNSDRAQKFHTYHFMCTYCQKVCIIRFCDVFQTGIPLWERKGSRGLPISVVCKCALLEIVKLAMKLHADKRDKEESWIRAEKGGKDTHLCAWSLLVLIRLQIDNAIIVWFRHFLVNQSIERESIRWEMQHDSQHKFALKTH